MMMLSVVLGLVAALCFVAARAFQHYATRTLALRRAEADGDAAIGWLPVAGLLTRLLCTRIWLYGLSFNVLGFVFHAGALHAGSITIVQALLVVQLLFALPFASIRTGGPPLTRDWVGTAFVCAGVILLIVVRGHVPQTLERREYAPIVAVTVGVLIAAIAAVAWTVRRYSDAHRVGRWGGRHLLRGHRDVHPALTAMTVADPLASWVCGALTGMLIVAGAALLAGSPALHDERPAGPARTASPRTRAPLPESTQ
jgi:drug/metabolite transporter (DMT)-like permease